MEELHFLCALPGAHFFIMEGKMTNQEILDKVYGPEIREWVEKNYMKTYLSYVKLKNKILDDERIDKETRDKIEKMIETSWVLENIRVVQAFKYGWIDCYDNVTRKNVEEDRMFIGMT